MLPVLLATPKYLAGELTPGSVMQIAAAFSAVLTAVNWFADNFIRLAEWSACAKRVDELHFALNEMDDDTAKTAAIILENTSPSDIQISTPGRSSRHRRCGYQRRARGARPSRR
jgi:vitamin B12/bleomycin/antimicrobial peptide transport system ATP-binding/permease protein